MKLILDTSICLWSYVLQQQVLDTINRSFQAIDWYDCPGIRILNRKLVVLYEERIAIVANIVQTIANLFEAKIHVQKDRKQRICVKHMIYENEETITLPKSDDTLLDGILELVLEFIKVHQLKKRST